MKSYNKLKKHHVNGAFLIYMKANSKLLANKLKNELSSLIYF